MYSTIIRQLEKALDCKDDKELRLRVEVLLDMIKDNEPRPYIPQQPAVQPVQSAAQSITPTVSGQSSPKISGAGAISSVNSEQINYKRPKGT